MSDFQKKSAITVAILIIIIGAWLKSESTPQNDDNVTPSEAWIDGPPKLLIVDETNKRGLYQGIAINSTDWRNPFKDAGGQVVYFDPIDDDDGEKTPIDSMPVWFPKALKRVNLDKLPYFVYASQGKVSVGHIKNSKEGADEFISKIVTRLPK